MKSTTLLSVLGLMAAPALASPVQSEYTSVREAPFGYKPGSKESIENLKDKVEHIVWVVLENRSFDNILGGVRRKGLDNPINNGPFCNPKNTSDPSSGKYCTHAKDYDSVLNDPDHSVTGNNLEFYGTYTPSNDAISAGKVVPDQSGFINAQLNSYPKLNPEVATTQVMGYYTEDEIPTIVNIVDEFITFNRWFSCVPGPTNPNRLCALAGTSAGHGQNDKDFMNFAIPTQSIFEAANEKNLTWLNYDGTNKVFQPDSLFFTNINKTSRANVVPVENFFQDAYLGVLPQLSYINPSCCGTNTNSMHPTGNVSYGEVFVKQIYDAVRQGPKWDKTLLFITYDETGGFFDHVPPPLAVRPDNLTYTETAKNGQNYTLSFDRLGGRLPTWIISPYTKKGHVEQYGTDPVTGKPSPYSATSVLKTLGYLWDIKDFTPRVAHSPSFDHLIGKTKRDTPITLRTPHTFSI
ncbi:phosphoesterase [Aspergillus coremiiformis]|uniref:Phosphoesterase n=1 Tax=Aspergillus coremiiformis TaxID=138285 RepID=A0A5N6YT51_9EURO|nr:phosphoesterase [Aspergillus coremiiformis]